jgi:2-C-methyl-D-erythritol 4-phosphate cytidylyltransferase
MGIEDVSKPKVCAIIAAAGESRRMNGTDKVLALLGGKPLLVWSIEAFQQSPEVDRIIIVNSQKNLGPVRCLALEQKWPKVMDVCIGGKRRQDSVAAGLALIQDCDWVIIHDGARPFVTRELIKQGLEAARETGAAIAAVPVTDTIKLAGSDQIVVETPPRSHLWAAQTPQIFRFSILKEAYRQTSGEVTDDASLVEQLGYKVKLYMGSYNNIKITTPSDLQTAARLLETVKPDVK